MPNVTRLTDGVNRPPAINIVVNGKEVSCYPGETVATALLAAGVTFFRRTPSGQLRAPVCNMGVCFECLVTIDGKEAMRSCMTRAADGMQVQVVELE